MLKILRLIVESGTMMRMSSRWTFSEDEVLFCCNGCSFFVSANEFWGFKKNGRIMMVGNSHNFQAMLKITNLAEEENFGLILR